MAHALWSVDVYNENTDLSRLPADPTKRCPHALPVAPSVCLSLYLVAFYPASHTQKYAVVPHWSHLWSCRVLCGGVQRTTVARKRLRRVLPASAAFHADSYCFFPPSFTWFYSFRFVWCCFSSMGRERQRSQWSSCVVWNAWPSGSDHTLF